MKILIDAFQASTLILAAPLVRGTVARLKALLQKRQGATVWRPYSELLKLFRKEELIPPTSSAVFRIAPVASFAAILSATAFIPVVHSSALIAWRGDFFVLVYLLALGRFFLSIGALDGGSAFGGMGASREALISSLAEAPFLLGLTAIAILSSRADVAGIVLWTLQQNFFNISTVHILAFAALVMVALAETGRMPVDNPTTHLELTMIHEGMVLEYSGPSLAFIEWASAIKLHIMIALLIALFAPWGISTGGSWASVAIALPFYVLKVGVAALLLSIIESAVAKLRMYLVPDFLGVAAALSALAVIFTIWAKR